MPAQILALTCCQVCPTAKVVCNMFVMSVSALLQASPAHACIASVAKSPSTHEKRCRSFEQRTTLSRPAPVRGRASKASGRHGEQWRCPIPVPLSRRPYLRPARACFSCCPRGVVYLRPGFAKPRRKARDQRLTLFSWTCIESLRYTFSTRP